MMQLRRETVRFIVELEIRLLHPMFRITLPPACEEPHPVSDTVSSLKGPDDGGSFCSFHTHGVGGEIFFVFLFVPRTLVQLVLGVGPTGLPSFSLALTLLVESSSFL